MAAPGNRGIWLAAVGAALLLAITLESMRAPTPLPRDAPDAQFSAVRAFDNLKDMLGDETPHPMGSAANTKVREILVAKLSALGYDVELQSGWACSRFGVCGRPTNILATQKSSADGDAILLTAHYDSVAAGPGASDDGVGVAAELEIARILAAPGHAATRHPVVILISDGEDAGLLGASLFVREHPLAKRIKAAVNMDSRGTSGLSLMFETGSANSWLMHLYASAIDRPITNSLYYVIYKLLPNNTDFSVFKAAGYQGFNFAFIGNVGFYHTPLDNLHNASLPTIQDQGGNALHALEALANTPDLNPPVSDSVFFDVLRRVLLIWPENAIAGISLCLLLACFAAAVLLVRRRRVEMRAIVWGLIGFLANVLLSAALGIAALMLLLWLGKVPPFEAYPWPAHPAPMHVASVALAVFAAGCMSIWLSRRAGFWGLWIGGAVGISAVAVAISLLNPGPVFPWLLASAAALLGALPVLFKADSTAEPRWALECAALLPGLVLLAVLLPMLLVLYQGLGAFAWPPTSIALCMVCSLWLPLLGMASPRLRRNLVWLSGGTAAVCLLITVTRPTFSTQWPQRINVEYWLDADTGRAHWWAAPASMHLPPQMAAAAGFGTGLTPRFAGTSQLGFSAPAESVGLQAPQLDLMSTAGAHHELRLRSNRDAATVFVIFPAAAGIKAAVLNTEAGALPVRLLEFAQGDTLLMIRNPPAAGVDIAVDSQAPPAARIYDVSYGLPSGLAQGHALQSARPQNATSTQDGDVTVLGRTVR